MTLTPNPESPSESPSAPTLRRSPVTEPNFARSAAPIAEFADRPDYPDCLHGQLLDIGGFVGVVVDIVRQSIKVRAADGTLQSFNFNRLRTLYGTAARREADRAARPAATIETSEPSQEAAPEVPRRQIIMDPDFNAPLKAIAELVSQPDFPRCAFGQRVEIDGYVGVVVEIVKESLKVRSAEGQTRSYNGPILRKLYGGRPNP